MMNKELGSVDFDPEQLEACKVFLYISGKTLKTVDIETLREENITSFLSSEYFESFHVSPIVPANGCSGAGSIVRSCAPAADASDRAASAE